MTTKQSHLKNVKCKCIGYESSNNNYIPKNKKNMDAIINKDFAVKYIDQYLNRVVTSKKTFCSANHIGVERLNEGLKELNFKINKKPVTPKVKVSRSKSREVKKLIGGGVSSERDVSQKDKILTNDPKLF